MKKVNLRSGEQKNKLLIGVHITSMAYGEFINCTFIDCSFAGTDVFSTHFNKCTIINCDFRTTCFESSGFVNCTIYKAKFMGTMYDTLITDSDLSHVKFGSIADFALVNNHLNNIEFEGQAYNNISEKYFEDADIDNRHNKVV